MGETLKETKSDTYQVPCHILPRTVPHPDGTGPEDASGRFYDVLLVLLSRPSPDPLLLLYPDVTSGTSNVPHTLRSVPVETGTSFSLPSSARVRTRRSRVCTCDPSVLVLPPSRNDHDRSTLAYTSFFRGHISFSSRGSVRLTGLPTWTRPSSFCVVRPVVVPGGFRWSLGPLDGPVSTIPPSLPAGPDRGHGGGRPVTRRGSVKSRTFPRRL